MLGWVGNFTKQKYNFKKFLHSKNIHFVEHHEANNSSKTHIIISYENFYYAVMQMHGSKGNEFRMKFLRCKEILDAYMKYENECERRSLLKNTDKLETLLQITKDEQQKAEIERRKAEERSNKTFEMMSECLEKLTDTTLSLQTVSAQSTIQPKYPSLQSCFAVYKLEDRLMYVSRGQKFNIDAAIRKLQKTYKNVKPVIKLVPEPNGTNLFVRLKNFFRNDPKLGVTVKGNKIFLGNHLDEITFIGFVQMIQQENMVEANNSKRKLLSYIEKIPKIN